MGKEREKVLVEDLVRAAMQGPPKKDWDYEKAQKKDTESTRQK